MPEDRFGGRPRTYPARPAQPQRPSGAASSGSLPALSIERCTPTQRGNVRLFVALRIGRGDTSILVDGFKLIAEEGKRPWVAPPSQERERTDPQTGEIVKKWYPTITLPDAWKVAVEKLLVDAWDTYQRDGILPGQVIGGQAK